MNGNIAVGTMVILVLFMMPTVAADNVLYFVPQDSSGAIGEEVTVSLYCDATDDIGGGQVRIYFDPSVVDITSGEEIAGTNWISWTFFPYGWAGHAYAEITFAQWGGSFIGDGIGIANLTLVGANPDESSLEMPVHPMKTMLFSPIGPAVSTDVVNGTFTCRAGDQPQCLGDCYEYEDCGGNITAMGVPCYVCLNATPPLGQSWNCTTRCPGRDMFCPDTCFNECPVCCDGIDNDGDGLTDCPADEGCACCCDATETDENADPCVPELPTLALAGIGILGAILLARKRE